MPTSETLERFIALVESNAHVEAVLQFYTADASMRERIEEETFFYDPAQLVPRMAPA